MVTELAAVSMLRTPLGCTEEHRLDVEMGWVILQISAYELWNVESAREKRGEELFGRMLVGLEGL